MPPDTAAYPQRSHCDDPLCHYKISVNWDYSIPISRETLMLKQLVAMLLLVASSSLLSGQQTPASAGAADPDIIEDLVVANHILAALGYIDAVGHVSARHSADPNRFLLAARTALPADVTADDIVEYDLDGNAVNLEGRLQHRERFIHAEIYRARPDVQAVIHSHYPDLVIFAGSALPLRPFYLLAAFIGDGVPVFDAQEATGDVPMLVGDSNMGRDLAGALNEDPAILLKAHGVVLVGPSIRHAVARLILLALNGRLLAQAVGLGEDVSYLSPEQAAWSREQLDAPQGAYDRQWEQWKREVDGP